MRTSKAWLYGGLAATLALVGCIAESEARKEASDYRYKSVAQGLAQPKLAAEESTLEVPQGGWTWEELAVRAGEKALREGSDALKIFVAQLKAAESVAWRDPELRFSRRWSEDRTWRHDDYRTDRRYARGDSATSSIGVRLYIPNPFINHYLRQQGAANVATREAEAAAEGYGVYTEVKMMCQEERALTVRIARLKEADAILTRGKALADASRDEGAAESPYDTIRMRALTERNRLKIRQLERERNQLRRAIATAAGVPENGFALTSGSFDLPDPAKLSSEDLVEKAFARRPDLARALAEYQAAEAGVGAAKAAAIPWFRFVEAGYRRQDSDDTTYDRWDTRLSQKESRGNDTFVEMAVTVPLFTWLGDSVSISRRMRDQADLRLKALYASVRDEVAAALDDYREAMAQIDPDAIETFAFEMKRRINECENSGADIAAASLKARLELNDFLEFSENQEADAREAALKLESVIGGPTGVPAREKGLMAALDYCVMLDGEVVETEPARISAMPFNRPFDGRQRQLDQTRMARFLQIETDKARELRVKFANGKVPRHLITLPMSRETCRAEGDEFVFVLDKPEQFVVDFGKDAEPLHVFVDKPWTYEPQPGDRYFGPGEHDAGVIVAKAGERIVLDKGAVVKGEIFAHKADGLVITGRGILDCSEMDRLEQEAVDARKAAGLPVEYDAEEACGGLVVSDSKNVTIDGIIVKDTPFWSVVICRGCKDVLIDDIKIIGQWRYSSDGVQVCASSDVQVKDSFIRTFAGCVAVRGNYLPGEDSATQNVLVQNCNLWCDWDVNMSVWTGHRPSLVENVSFLTNRLLNVTHIPAGVSTWYCSTNTVVRNITFENVELDLRPDRPREILQQSDDQKFVHDPWSDQLLFQVYICPPSHFMGGQVISRGGDFPNHRVSYDNILLKDFELHGDSMLLTANVRAMGRNQKIRGVRCEGLPEFNLSTYGDVEVSQK